MIKSVPVVEKQISAPKKKFGRKEFGPKHTVLEIVDSEEEEDVVFANSSDSEESEDSESQEGRSKTKNRLIEKILGRKKEGETVKLLVKEKGISYLHVKWYTVEKLSGVFFNAKHHLKKLGEDLDENEEGAYAKKIGEAHYFNPEYVKVSKVLDLRGKGDSLEYLCKWEGLTFSESTWENYKDVPKESVEAFESRTSQVRKPYSNERGMPAFKKEFCVPKFKGENELREYQKEGFEWLVFSWYNKVNTCLADEMGLGKTIQALAVLHYLRQVRKVEGPFFIVAPLSTIEQWRREIAEWTDMDCLVAIFTFYLFNFFFKSPVFLGYRFSMEMWKTEQ